MHVPKTKIKRKKKQFSGVPSRGLKWENKTYKLKTSITFQYYFPSGLSSSVTLPAKIFILASDELLDVHFVTLFTCTLYGLQYTFPNFVHSRTYLKLILGVGLQLGRNWWFKILCSSEIIASVLSLKAYVQASCHCEATESKSSLMT